MKFNFLYFFLFFFLAGYGISLGNEENYYKKHLDSFEVFLPRLNEWNDTVQKYELVYGKNIKCDSVLRPALISALQAYPELWDVNIELKFRNISTTMQARPGKWFIIKSKSKRTYKIIVNKNNLIQALNIKNLDFSVQYGIFGHELAHFYEYSKKNALGMSFFGLKYGILKNYRKFIETEADLLALKRGFAYSIYKLKFIMFFSSDIDSIYKNKLKKYYLQLDEILDFIKNK